MMQTVAEIAGADATPERFGEVVQGCKPVLLRQLVGHWPAVEAGRRSPAAFRDYLSRFDVGGKMEAFIGAPEIAGKYFYGADLEGFNFRRCQMSFGSALEVIIAQLGHSEAESIYVGSLPVSD